MASPGPSIPPVPDGIRLQQMSALEFNEFLAKQLDEVYQTVTRKHSQAVGAAARSSALQSDTAALEGVVTLPGWVSLEADVDGARPVAEEVELAPCSVVKSHPMTEERQLTTVLASELKVWSARQEKMVRSLLEEYCRSPDGMVIGKPKGRPGLGRCRSRQRQYQGQATLGTPCSNGKTIENGTLYRNYSPREHLEIPLTPRPVCVPDEEILPPSTPAANLALPWNLMSPEPSCGEASPSNSKAVPEKDSRSTLRTVAGGDEKGHVPGRKTRQKLKRGTTSTYQSFLDECTFMTFLDEDDDEKTFSQQLTENMERFFSQDPLLGEGCLAEFIGSRMFTAACSCAIVINAAFIAYTSNYAMANLDKPVTAGIDIVEAIFCAFYCVELLLRIAVYRKFYFLSNEWAWNTLDVVLVLVSVQEMIMRFLPVGGVGVNISFLRIVRVMKMIRLFRVVRLMRMFRELRLIWNSIFGSMKAIFWAMVLIASVAFMAGVCFVQAATEYLRDNMDALSEEDVTEIQNSWGSCQRSMLALYQSVTGGRDWGVVSTTLWTIGPGYYMLFLAYILFHTCVISNTITSLFVEATIANSQKDYAAVIQDAMAHKQDYLRKLRGWFEHVDADGKGYVSFDEFCARVQDPEALAFLSTLHIEVTDMQQFFAILSENGTRPVDMKTFVIGCLKLQGAARSMDLLEMMIHQRSAFSQAKKQINALEDSCKEEFTKLKKHLEALALEGDYDDEGHFEDVPRDSEIS
eukprot:TRINITY_DN2776_c0_g1_i1.p1 TRINITY_DN2776_c0_g1~~TRINITY_DN2776_c0_g1_i1.p1  ORF type:complete len:759 (+),score=121.04 TRINITY_DN2776_c0_g1_i1:37-2277(+)